MKPVFGLRSTQTLVKIYNMYIILIWMCASRKIFVNKAFDIKLLSSKIFFIFRSEDDPFVLIAALACGPNTMFLTNDTLRQHFGLLRDSTEMRLFTRYSCYNYVTRSSEQQWAVEKDTVVGHRKWRRPLLNSLSPSSLCKRLVWKKYLLKFLTYFFS